MTQLSVTFYFLFLPCKALRHSKQNFQEQPRHAWQCQDFFLCPPLLILVLWCTETEAETQATLLRICHKPSSVCPFAHAALLTEGVLGAQGEAPIWKMILRAVEQSALWDMPAPSLQGLSLHLSNTIPRTTFPKVLCCNLQAKPSVCFNRRS